MRDIILSVAAIAGIAYVTSQWLSDRTADSQQTHRVEITYRDSPQNSDIGSTSGDAVFKAGSDGHVRLEARVNARAVKFMVDTGASVVVLRESDARRLGLTFGPRDFSSAVSTANGRVMAAPVTLDEVRINRIRVSGVKALVLPDSALGENNLLGMSFLSRLKRFEMSNGELILEN